MFACLIVFHLLKHLKCLHVSLFSSALPLFACMCPFPALRDHSVKRRLSHLIQFCPIYILAVSHINTFIPGGYGNSAIEKKTRHVNDSLQDFNSGIPLCFKSRIRNDTELHWHAPPNPIYFIKTNGLISNFDKNTAHLSEAAWLSNVHKSYCPTLFSSFLLRNWFPSWHLGIL